MSGQMCVIENGELYYQITGAGEAIVFIHGFSLDLRMWKPQVEFFNKTNTVLAYDVRGFGKSSLASVEYDDAQDLFTLLNHLNIKSAHLVGLSMGGRVATNFTLAYPKMVRSLTLMDSAIDGYESEVDWSVYAKEQGLTQAKDNWLRHDLFTYTNQNEAVAKALREIVDDYSGWHWLNTDLHRSVDIQPANRLNEIAASTLVMIGEHDLQYFHNMSNKLADEIPGATKFEIPDAGHMINMESPDLVNAQLSHFFNNI